MNIRLQVDAIKDALVVPSSAIQRGAQGILVYVIKSDSTVTVRRARIGITEGDLTSIQGEVSAGELVVTDGADRLREGAKVDVITAATKDRGADKTSTRERASEAPGVSAPASSAGEGGERPRWMDRLPPELVEKVKAMSPEDRRAFLQKMREQRRAEGQ